MEWKWKVLREDVFFVVLAIRYHSFRSEDQADGADS